MAGKLGAPMLESEFLMELLRLKLDWSLDERGRLRGLQRPGGMFRTWLMHVCPICSVANATAGTHLASGYSLGAFALGIPTADALQIVHAADNVPGHNELLRRRLLEACGLKAKP